MNRHARLVRQFDKHYKCKQAKRLIIHPVKRIESAAALTHDVEGVTVSELRKLEKAGREFLQGL